MKIQTKEDTKLFTYKKIANILEQQILNGTLKVGDKLPSLRILCREYGISQNTALNAYYFLERKMLIETKPQSGYYVRNIRIKNIQSDTFLPEVDWSQSSDAEIIHSVYKMMGSTSKHPLALSTPSMELLPIKKLQKSILESTKKIDLGVSHGKMEGSENLRRQVARWAYAAEININHQDLITTNGCLNAIFYCLKAVTQKGDTIGMESPISFGMLQIANVLELKIIELPTDLTNGICLNSLEKLLQKQALNALLLISNFSNPAGFCIPPNNKKTIVDLLEKYGIPIIENDINADIFFGKQRPLSLKSFDKSGNVLWCSSVSKTLAPGYRVGWVAPGKYYEAVRKLKLYHTITTPSITEEVIAIFLETGRYEYHLFQLRKQLHSNLNNYISSIEKYFPEETIHSNPNGGIVLWLQLLNKINTVELYEMAMKLDIGFAPGRIFTLKNQYLNCLRLNYGLEWSDALEEKLKQLGGLVKSYC